MRGYLRAGAPSSKVAGMGKRHAIATLVACLAIFGAAASARADFASCLSALRGQALAHGITSATFSNYAAGLKPNDAPKFLGAQPEFNIPVWDYLGGLVDQQRVSDGVAQMKAHAHALATAEERFGVDRFVVAAVWGVESDYGRDFGKRPVVASLASLSCVASRRQAYFRKEFVAALRLLQERQVRPDRFYGSWAGAFGNTQFMPTTFFQSAVDMDGDGRADIIDSPADALGSTANFLRQHGWKPGLPWGFEVRLPTGYKGPSGRRAKRTMAFWTAHGLRKAYGSGLGAGAAALLLPAGRAGPAFLVTRNFEALYSYNEAESYALAIGLLSNRLRGLPPLAAPWPGGERGLSRIERREMQALLTKRGYDIGEADGVLGAKSRAAMADAQRKMGMTPNGWATPQLLKALEASQ
ncbi:MAG TPA: lytic murein transglycosylase [Beijerinckiaceae bacterium]|nr:lytic murein transglycosylase [Beijerinckiaceae bacterium]